ncbi:MAG: T9SS type B sorting domain-containing protein [Flavobacterium sp.]|uniref:Ig-like domain-containing protein n=1 Tax=Flavobacterium sp. TaxID=239 RepID=UPI00122A4478|nr:T9SS type B sorting domain-containing protein [Flavobacterium sp.]RZJ63411.1 MAG: T9SS type B sorting domain-containing protein [Flavobacterium sp.]
MFSRLILVVLFVWSISIEAQTTNAPPILSAFGPGAYCPGGQNRIVSNMTITDADNISVEAMYIQISSGYISSQDLLTLTGNHPLITTTWDSLSGKLTLKSPTNILVPYTAFEVAIEDVLYTNSNQNPSGSRTFSITIGQANYLASTGHYYLFVPFTGIHWTVAKVAAENSTYFGLQGYLATILSQDEAQLCGEQSNGAGWIGGSDSQQEGVWKWMTGPEAGTIFWNGAANGTTPNFAFWNNGEPNNLDEEDYAHITAPGVGITGSWNDLGDEGGGPGDYEPKGYIVEFGGMPGDPLLNISTSTTMVIPTITSTTPASQCGPGALILQATATGGTVHWYDSATGGNLIAMGNGLTTPVLSTTTTYYVNAFDASCSAGTRIPVVATVNDIPTVVATTAPAQCEGVAILSATASSGTINWYTEAVGGTPIATGETFETPYLSESTTYYAEALSGGNCPGARVQLNVIIYPLPQVSPTIELGFCEGSSLVLNAFQPNLSYLWSTGETTSQITITTQGIYSVTLSTPENCTAIQYFQVLHDAIPVIGGAVVVGNELTIYTTNTGNFEYSIDGVTWQSSPVFVIDGSPISMVYAQSVSNCGSDDLPFEQIIVIPNYFTPNADSFHDQWTVNGMIFHPDARITVFDRYGKLITTLTNQKMFWDGTYNGQFLPSTDYWFVLKLNDELPEVKGHFALKR